MKAAKRSIYNILFGLVSQLLTIALGIVIPRLILVNFGSEVNGLLSSIGQMFIYLSLLEAGVGAATIQALYKPISKNDKDSINSILTATSVYYKKTGMYYFFGLLILSVTYPFIINSNLNKLSVIIIIFLFGLGGALNFYFQGKYRLLLTAEGKGYINTSISTVNYVLINIIKIVLLLLGYNIIIIQVSYVIVNILQIFIFEIYIRKNYKWLNLNAIPDYNAISQKNSVLIHQISALVFSNTDVLILTIFCGLKVVSVYVMYNMLFSMIDVLIGNFNSSITFVLGQSFHENKEKFIGYYEVYETYFFVLVFSVFAVLYILILPFINLYTAGINDIKYDDFWLPILFVTLKLLSSARSPAGEAINIAGHFKSTQTRSIIEAAINIVFSLLFVNMLGIYGVLLGTIAALMYRTTDIIIYANKKILNRSPWKTTRRCILDLILLLIIVFISSILKINPTSYLNIIYWAIALTAVIMPVYLIANLLVERDVYTFTIGLIKMYKNSRNNMIDVHEKSI